ncbi:MAG: hypothetical protein P8011_15875 [Acidihalobacter sp.]|uniref:hypothetical protein n=1 Tax=Acidihalobacter sp. TaxID=1872108 RepID=UPI00307F41A1
MDPKQDFNRLYSNVSASISAALLDISELRVDHEQGQKEIGNMMARLRDIQARFDDELNLLERHAEWDKFTIAFFGETNAGKSTILESLRILFHEETRQQLLEQNAGNLEKYKQALDAQVNCIREQMYELSTHYVGEIEAIQRSTSALSLILREESAARIRTRILVAGVIGVAFGSALGAVFAHFLLA